MAVFIVQAVTKSYDGSNSVRVASRWPYEADDLEHAKAFVDATPDFSGWDVEAFEVVTTEGKLLSKRPCTVQQWEDAKEKPLA